MIESFTNLFTNKVESVFDFLSNILILEDNSNVSFAILAVINVESDVVF